MFVLNKLLLIICLIAAIFVCGCDDILDNRLFSQAPFHKSSNSNISGTEANGTFIDLGNEPKENNEYSYENNMEENSTLAPDSSVSENNRNDVRVMSTQSPNTSKSIAEVLAALSLPKNPIYKINNGDEIEITIAGEPTSKREITVRPDGYINYLYNIEFRASGLSYEEFRSEVQNKLSKYYRAPEVTVIGKTFSGSSVYVMGPIGKPGKHTIQNDTRLLQVLAQAGVMSKIPQTLLTSSGERDITNDVINLKKAFMVREGKILPIDFEKLLLSRDMRYNIYIDPNDFIFFPSSYLLESNKRVYVCGTVETPRVYKFNTYGTFVSAIANSGGALRYRADMTRCLLVRKNLNEPMVINYYDIVHGKKKDIILEDADIIYVPDRKMYKNSRWISTALGEVVAPLQTILNADTMLKMYNYQNWGFSSPPSATELKVYDESQYYYGRGR